MFNVSRQRRHHWCAVMRAATARHCSYLHPHSDDSDGKHNTIKIDFLKCVLCMLNKARDLMEETLPYHFQYFYKIL